MYYLCAVTRERLQTKLIKHSSQGGLIYEAPRQSPLCCGACFFKQSVLSVPTVPTPTDSGETKWLFGFVCSMRIPALFHQPTTGDQRHLTNDGILVQGDTVSNEANPIPGGFVPIPLLYRLLGEGLGIDLTDR